MKKLVWIFSVILLLQTLLHTNAAGDNERIVIDTIKAPLTNYLWDMRADLIEPYLRTQLKLHGLVAIYVKDALINKKYAAWVENGSVYYHQTALPVFITSAENLTMKTVPLFIGNKEIGSLAIYTKPREPFISLTKEEKAYIKAHPVIRVVEFFEEPPFTINTPDGHQGYLYELLEQLLAPLGLKAEYVGGYNTYDAMLQSLERNQVDILTSVENTYPLPANSHIIKSNPVLVSPYVLVGRIGAVPVGGTEELFGQKVAVVKGYAQDKLLDRFPEIEKVHVRDNKAGFEAVRRNEAVYFLNNRANAEYVIHKEFATDLSIKGELPYSNFPSLTLSYGLNRTQPELISIIEKSLDQMDISTLQSLKTKWLESKQKIEPAEVTLSEEEQAWLEKHPEATVAMVNFSPLFSYMENGERKGFEQDLLSLLSRKIGLKFKPVYNTWGRNLDQFKAQKIDLVLRLSYKKERESFALFTKPYYEMPTVIYVRDDFGEYKGLDSLKGKRVGTLKGIYYSKELKEYGNLELTEYESHEETVKALVYGRIDALVHSLSSVKYAIQKNAYVNLRLVDELRMPGIGKEDMRIGVNPDKPILQSILQKGLDAITDKERFELINKWIGSVAAQPVIQKISLSEEERVFLNTKGSIKMCSAPGRPPMEWIDEKIEHQGISADYVKLIAQIIDHPIVLVPTKNWNKTIENAKARKCDFVSSITQTVERSSYLNFTNAYQELDVVIATRLEQIYIQNLNTLAGKKVGVVKNSVFQSILADNFPPVEIVALDNMYQGLRMVQDREIMGFVDYLTSLAYTIQQKGLVDIKISGHVGSPIKIHMGVRNDEPMLHQILSRALDSITPQQRQEFASKWVAVKFEQATDYSLLWKVLVAVALVLLGIIYWNRKLSILNQTITKKNEDLLKIQSDLELSRIEAEKASQSKSEFLANMSHELRTPLNAILGFSQILAHGKNLLSEQKEYLQTINRSGEHLLRLINDVLDMSKIEAGRVTLNETEIDLYLLLDDLKSMFEIKAREKRLELNFEYAPGLPQYLKTDEAKLRQVLINLLSNAIKFTPKGRVSLKVSQNEASTPKLFFQIEDTGSGMTEEEIKHCFHMFVQAQAGKESHEGTGLGLPISQKFVQLMGGNITVTSQPGKGSVFKFDIQVHDIQKVEIVENRDNRRVIGLDSSVHESGQTDGRIDGPPLRRTDPANYRILIVDDIMNNRQLLKALLAPLGLNIRSVGSGKEALEVWKEWQPHLIWLDLRMPEIDGYEVIQQIRKTPSELFSQKRFPIIISISASAFEESKRKAFNAGCDGFITKPFKEFEIFEEMKKHLGLTYIYDDTPMRDNASGEITPDESPDTQKNRERAATGPQPQGTHTDQDRLTIERMGNLSADWKEKLKLACLSVDVVQMKALADQLQKEDESIADLIRHFINKFEYQKILDALEDE